MKRIFIIICVCVFTFANTSVADTIYAKVNADTATIWHKDFHTNCGSLYMMDFVMADNHINVYEIDTGGIAYCFCYFDLNTVIAALSPGYYTVDVYEKWRKYPNDSSFLGSTSFVIEGSIPNVPYLLRNFQSDCFQNVGQSELQRVGNTTFSVKSVDPNPVSSHTTIHIEIYNPALVEISVFNAMGQQVEVVYNGWLDKGIQTLNWNVYNLNQGFYILKFSAGQEISTTKILVVQ